MALNLITAPSGAERVVTTADLKAHLRIDSSFTDDDTYLAALMDVCVLDLEDWMSRRLITQTWEETFDKFPVTRRVDTVNLERMYVASQVVQLSYVEVTSVTSVSYYDEDDALIVWNASKYQTDLRSLPARIMPTPDEGTYPATRVGRFNAVIIRYVVGYANAASVPAPIKHAIKMMVADMYRNRTPAERKYGVMDTAQMLANTYRYLRFM